MKFKYIAYEKNGKKIKGTIEAPDEKEAKELLKHLYIIEIKPSFSFDISFGKVSKKEIAKVLYTLGLYLKSSIPLKKALSLTKNQSQNPKIKKFLSKIQNEINAGKNFKTALENQNIIKLPSFVINSIAIAENSGKLDLILIELSKFLKDEEKIASKTTQALMYPFFIISVSIVLLIVMLTTIVPKIVKMFKTLNQELPTATKIVLTLSEFVQKNYITIITVFFLTIFLFKLLYSKSKKFKYAVDSLYLKIPILKKLITSKELGRFSYMLNTLTTSGVNFVNALNMSINTIQNEKIKSYFQIALNDVLEGKKLSTSLKKHGFYETNFIESIALAEESGEMENILQNISEMYLEEYESKTSTLLSLLEPVMMVVIGSIIGFIVTAMLLPIFSMNIGS